MIIHIIPEIPHELFILNRSLNCGQIMNGRGTTTGFPVNHGTCGPVTSLWLIMLNVKSSTSFSDSRGWSGWGLGWSVTKIWRKTERENWVKDKEAAFN